MIRTIVTLFSIIAVCVIAGIVYLREPVEIDIDNAYVSGRIIRVYAPRSGYIGQATIWKSQSFQSGEATIHYDTNQIDLEIQEQTARFKLNINNELVSCFVLKKAMTEYQRSKAERDHSEVRFGRIQSLIDVGSKLSPEEVAQRKNDFIIAKKDVDVAAIDVERLQSLNKLSILERATVQESEALLRKRLHERSLYQITLPFAGYVYESLIYPGKYVSEGELLAIVVPREQLMIEANVLESRLGQIRPGQKVDIKPDMHPDETLTGYVHSVVPSTAATFSMLPRNNTDSNWIKVSQRVPVLVGFNSEPSADINLALGASVRLTVHLGDNNTRPPEANDELTGWSEGSHKSNDDEYVQNVISSIMATLTETEKASCQFRP